MQKHRSIVAALIILGLLGGAHAETKKLSPNDLKHMQTALYRAVRNCMPPLFDIDGPQTARFMLHFNRDSTLSTRPQLLSSSSTAFSNAVTRALVRCLSDKNQLNFSPKNYKSWKSFTFEANYESF